MSPTLALFLFVLAAALFAYEVIYPRVVGLFETNWAVATILFYLLVESVLATRYCSKHGIKLGDFGE
jgi:hypothetical protein